MRPKKKYNKPKTVSNESESATPREQRVRKARIDTEEPSSTPKPIENPPAVSFENLKRETDEIKKISDGYEKREICSNWTKYDILEDAEDYTKPADFSELLSVSRGGHFRFKYEKDWDVSVTSKYGEHFTLDLNDLSNSLPTIPLYERHRIDLDVFTEAEINEMNRIAASMKNVNGPISKLTNVNEKDVCILEKVNNDKVVSVVEPTEIKKSEPQIKTEFVSGDVVKPETVSNQTENISAVITNNKALDEPKPKIEIESKSVPPQKSFTDTILEVKIPLQSNSKKTATPTVEAEELERWLDDILDD